jgi:hypothetical protein
MAEHRGLRVAGSIDQHQQRHHHTKGDALQDTQRQLSGDDDRGDSKLPTTAGEQVAQVAGLGEVEHRCDHDGGKRRVRHAPEQRRQRSAGRVVASPVRVGWRIILDTARLP